MLEKNYIKTLLKQHGVQIGHICAILNIDRQKLNRWSEDDHPNNKVLRAAVKFALRYLLNTRESEAQRLQKIEQAEQEYYKRLNEIGL